MNIWRTIFWRCLCGWGEEGITASWALFHRTHGSRQMHSTALAAAGKPTAPSPCTSFERSST